MCSPILCIYIIVIIILLIYMWDFNSIMYVYMTHFSYNNRLDVSHSQTLSHSTLKIKYDNIGRFANTIYQSFSGSKSTIKIKNVIN
jgi:hypothetical protein